MLKSSTIQNDMSKAPKTGDWSFMIPEVDKDKCTGCSTCVPYCPEASIILKKMEKYPRPKADVDYEYCKGCGVCSTVCPVKAIAMRKK